VKDLREAIFLYLSAALLSPTSDEKARVLVNLALTLTGISIRFAPILRRRSRISKVS
jgi:hypothetical protein